MADQFVDVTVVVDKRKSATVAYHVEGVSGSVKSVSSHSAQDKPDREQVHESGKAKRKGLKLLHTHRVRSMD